MNFLDRLGAAPARTHWIAALLLLVFAVLCGINAEHASLTYDEPQHFRYGAQILLEHNSDRFDDSKMPLSVLNALPRALALTMQPLTGTEHPNPWLYDAKTGRYMTILVGVLLGVFVFRWSKELYGPKGGLLSLFLYALSPNLIAHASLITTDLYASAGITIALYYYWRFLKNPNVRSGSISALTLGIAQVAKYTAVYLYPIFIVLAAVFFFETLRKQLRERDFRSLWRGMTKALLWAATFFLVIVVVINIAYLFNRTFTPLSDYQLRSALFQQIQAHAGILGKIPIPFPYPYLEGLDWVIYVNSHLANKIYLLGELKEGSNRFPCYYCIVVFFKEPIAALLITTIGLLVLSRRLRWERFLRNEGFLLIPVFFLIVYFFSLFNTQIGIRFILPIFPLLYILCGQLLTEPIRRHWEAAILALMVYQSISVLSYLPSHIPYFNELVWDRTQVYRILADSNVSWGQEEYLLETYAQKHPEIMFYPSKPTKGKIAVDVNFLTGIFPKSNLSWLRDNFQPVGRIGYTQLLYDVTPDAYEKLLDDTPRYFPPPPGLQNVRDDYYTLNRWQGSNLERIGNLRDALIHYRKLAAYAPLDPEPLRDLVRVHRRLGENTEAESYQRELVRLSELERLYQQALAADSAKDFPRALEYLDRLIEQQPDYKLALFYHGLMLQMQDRHAEAIPDYRRFRKLYPAYYQNIFNLAFALMKTGACEEAASLFARTLVLKPDYAEASIHLRACEERLKLERTGPGVQGG